VWCQHVLFVLCVRRRILLGTPSLSQSWLSKDTLISPDSAGRLVLLLPFAPRAQYHDKRGTPAQGLDSVLQSHGVLPPKTDATGATAEDVEKRRLQELKEQTDMVRVLSAKKAEAEMVHI